MKNFKQLPMAMSLVGLGAAMSFAEIKVSDNLALTGFIDMSVSGEANDSTESLNASFDQFELDFMYKFGDKISARADINSLGGGEVAFEQGFVTYANGPFSFSTGRFLSSSGFEAAEPTGLYQYSYAKSCDGTVGGGCVYGGYQNGINLAYSTPTFGLYGAVVSDLWTSAETDVLNSPGFEAQLSLTPVEGFTAKVAYLYQMYDEDATGDASQQLLNAWASYAAGPITVAAEYNLLLDWVVPDSDDPAGMVNDGTGHGWLGMVNYKFNDVAAATIRYSGVLLGDADPDQEVTFSPSLALSPNWLALAEVKYQIDAEVTSYGVEGLFSF